MSQATHTQHPKHWGAHQLEFLLILTLFLFTAAQVFAVDSHAMDLGLSEQIIETKSATTTTWSLDHLVAESVTIRTRVMLHGDIDNDLSSVWLAALVTNATSPDAVLALAVQPKTVGWLTAWNLELHVYPVNSSSGSPITAGKNTPTVISLGALSLQPDTPYETIFSFNQLTGQLDVRLTNNLTGAILYKGQQSVAKQTQPLYPALAMATRSHQQGVELVLEAFDVHDVYIPGGAGWALARESDWQQSTDSIRRVVSDESLGIRLWSKSAVADGTFNFVVEYQGARKPLFAVVPIQGDTFTPLSRSALLPGSSQLVLEYVAGGRTWFSETQPLTVGQIEASFDRAVVDREAGVVTSSMEIASLGTLNEVTLDVTGSLTRLVWDDVARRYNYQPYGDYLLFSDTLTLTFEPLHVQLQLPVLPDAPGTWQIQYTLQTTPVIAVQQNLANRYFSTYLPPDPSDESFTVAILPDTQIYAQSFPEIFTRQTEWLAQNAQELNLAFVLHLGDITNTSAAEEWQNALRSMSLLNGVVPYALTVGNHDMGSNRQTNSRSTPLNTYFPLQYYEGLRGTFEPGRAENSYHVFRAGGREWLVIMLEFGPRDEVLAWANQVATDHADLPIIIVTHTYTTTSGLWLTGTGGAAPISYPYARNPGESVNDGLDMWMKFVRQHPNILMVVSGHIGHEGIPRQAVKGNLGNTVYEMLLDYQYLPLGGEGWMGLMEFQPHTGRILVLSYSPYLDSYREGVFGGFTNHFIIDQAAGQIKNVGLGEVCAVALRLCR
jgi:hypothetical protein